jgi:hypothetical protein
MPGKTKATDPATHLSDEAIRQRAYFLWEQDGRPEGRADHYWHLARDEAHKAHRAMVEEMGSRTAAATGGRNPAELPAGAGKPGKAKSAESGKTPKPRSAAQKAL